jgi:energy-coupling factor transporter ATP-binding protein EcfA2
MATARAERDRDLEPTERDAQVFRDAGLRRVRWSTLRPAFMREWEPGQHVAVIGPTGSGKSYLALDLLEYRAQRRGAHVIALGTKKRDTTLESLGWPRIKSWPPDYEHRELRRVILWPDYKTSSTAKENRPIYVHALDEILAEGGWTVYLDEAAYFVETLRMREQLDEYWNTARSAGITVVSSSQGVSWVPRAALTEQQWMFIFRLTDEDVRDRAAQIAGDRKRFAPVITRLRDREFLMVRTRTGDAYISRVGT